MVILIWGCVVNIIMNDIQWNPSNNTTLQTKNIVRKEGWS